MDEILYTQLTNQCTVTDKQLIDGIKNNDYISYNQLFLRYFPRLCQYVYSLIQNKEDAEDIVQELFLLLWKNRKIIEIHENVRYYLFRMAKNLTLNYIKKQKMQTIPLDEGSVKNYFQEEELLETDEFRISLFDCIDQLPDRSKEVFLLHRINGLKQKEIAEKLSISIQTIKNQIYNSVTRLKKCLVIKGFE